MSAEFPSTKARGLLALLAVPVAFCLQWWLWPIIQPFAWFFFYPAVLFCSWQGGRRSGIIATVLCAFLAWYFFMPPGNGSAFDGVREGLSLLMFVAIGIAFSELHARLQAATAQNARALEEARNTAEELETSVSKRNSDLESSRHSLHESRRFAQGVVDSLTAHIAIIDLEGQILATNSQWQRFTTENPSFPTALREGANYLESWDHAGRDKYPELKIISDGVRSVLSGALSTFSWDYPCHVGTEQRWFTLRVTPFPGDGPRRVVITHENITEKKLAELAVRENEERIRTLGDNLHGGAIYQLRAAPDGRVHYTYMSAGVEKIFGLTAQSIMEDPTAFWDLLPEEDRARLQEIQYRSATELTVFDCEFRQRTVLGHTKWLWARSTPHRQTDGAILWDGIVMDITPLKSTEQAVRESEQSLRLALAAAKMGVWVWDIESDRVELSPECVTLLGEPHFSGRLEDFQNLIHPDDLERTRDGLREAIASGTVYAAEFRVVRRDGSMPWLGSTGRTDHDPATGKPLRFVGTILDITQRRQASLDLAHLAAIVESSDDAIIGKTLNGTIVSWNRAAERLYGYTRTEMMNQPITSFIPEQAKLEFEDLMARIRRGERVPTLETVRQNKDGTLVEISLTLSPIIDSNGTILGVSSIAQNISDRKKAEAARRNSEYLLRSVLDANPNLIFVKDRDAVIYIANEPLAVFYSTTIDGLEGRSQADLHAQLGMPQNEIERWIRDDREVIDSGKTKDIEEFSTWKDGSHHWYHTYKIPILLPNGTPAVLVVSEDITKHKQALEALAESEQRFRQVTDAIDQVFWMSSVSKSEVLYVSPSYESIWGRTTASLHESFDTFIEALHPDDRARIQKALTRQTDGGYDEEYRIVRPDGSERWIRDRAFPIYDSDGQVRRVAGIADDITERKKQEAEKEKLVHLVEHSSDLIAMADLDGYVFYMNTAGRRMLGVPEGEIKRLHFTEYTAPEMRDVFEHTVRTKDLWEGEMQLHHLITNAPIDVFRSTFLIRDPATKLPMCFATVTRDIRDRKRMERDLLKISEREQHRIGMDLHDGLGQEFTAISMLNNVLQRSLQSKALPEAATAARVAELLKNAAIQMQRIARGLQPVEEDPRGLVAGLESLVSGTTGSNGATCTFECPDALAIPDNEIATHLFRIAQEALQNALKHAQAKNIVIRLLREGSRVLLEVQDDGTGRSVETYKNNGLGLHTMRYRTEAMSGQFEILHPRQGGTVVRCSIPYLPSASEPSL